MPYDLCEDDPTLDIIESAMASRGITQEMINETRAALERRMMRDVQSLVQEGAEALELLLESGAKTEVKDSDGWSPLHAAACWGQVHVAEQLVSHGASLNAKTFLEETPIDLCEDEEFRKHLLELKHKREIIMKTELKHRSSLCRRTSSAGSRGIPYTAACEEQQKNSLSREEQLLLLRENSSRSREASSVLWQTDQLWVQRFNESVRAATMSGKEFDFLGLSARWKVVRRASLSDRHNLCRREYQTEAIVWRGGREEERESDQDSTLTTGSTAPLSGILKDSGQQNGCASPPASPAPNGDPLTTEPSTPSPSPGDPRPKERAQTLSDLKKQRAAAKLLAQSVLNGSLIHGSSRLRPQDPIMPLVSTNGSAVYFTPASGDPPLLKLKQPVDDEDPKSDSCCCIA
ncbi:hypothetical protein DNTS_003504 [Danionella cerebrum]|nr:hypothetical protein DNTS_003504 [Danionella translucida]TRY54034.1 hypothetical protein DNTS_003504 [Danionella translucida]